MKRNSAVRALAFLLCLLLTPGTAGAISWGDFVQKVNTEIASSAQGDVMITSAVLGDSFIDAPQAGDAALTAASGYTAIIQGLTFTGGMLISGGELVLENVTVLNDNGHGITIVGDANGISLELTLDENSVIGASTAAVDGNGIHYYDMVGTANNDIVIHNAADIYAEGAGIHLNTISSGNLQIDLENSGDIHAQDDVGLYARGETSGGDVTVRIVNTGTVTGATEYGIHSYAAVTNGTALSEIENHGAISDIAVGTDGSGGGAYAFSFATNGSATSRIVNDGVITNTGGAALTTNVQVNSNGTATSTVDNSGTIINCYNGIVANAVNFTGDAITDISNSGDIDALRSGLLSNANAFAGEANITINNDGDVHGDERYGITTYGNGDQVNIGIENNGEASGGRAGLFVEGPAQMDLTVSGNGLYQPGTFTGPATNNTYDGVNAILFVDYRDINAVPQGQALEDELMGIAGASGLTTLQDGKLVMVAWYADPAAPGVGIHDFSTPMRAPQPGPGPDPWPDPWPDPLPDPWFDPWFDPWHPSSGGDAGSVFEPEPEPPPPPAKPRPSYQGITYSEEWLYQAYLANASRDLRVYELAADESGLPEKGKHLVFKESLHGNIQLTLTNYSQEQLLVVVSMPMLKKMISMGIHTLNILGEKTADSYPIEEIYNALVASGQGDAQYVYLAGMEADAVIIDRDGNKAAL